MAKCNTKPMVPKEFNFDLSRDEVVMIRKALAKISTNKGIERYNMTREEASLITSVYMTMGNVINEFNIEVGS